MSSIELLVAITILVIATGAVARAYSASLDYQNHSEKTRERLNAQYRFEDRLTQLISGATLKGANGCFISPVTKSDAGVEQHAATSILAPGSASLVVTSLFDPTPVRYLTSSDNDFQHLNQTYGPMVGTSEVALSLVPVGDAGSKQGLFLRVQRPADSDPKQGGTESDLNPDVEDIRFEFYDGTTWQTTWDSTDTQKGQLPLAVRVTYLLRGDQQPKSFLIRLEITGGGGS
jgi:type II secretory pathway pseudopilin PulG